MHMSSIGSFFLLGTEARGRFLRIARHVLGCTYICTWNSLCRPAANHLISTDGWHEDIDTSSSSISLGLFLSYRRSLCSIQNGCIPGLAYKGGLTYIELRDSDLMNLASMQVQRQFYQEAGIKTTVFMGCRYGEIELGFTTSPHINMQMDVQQVFSEGFIQQPQLEEDFIENSMARAMLAVISSASSSSSTLMHQQLQQQQQQTYPYRHPVGAFTAYNPSLALESQTNLNFTGQRMIKMGIYILRRIRMMRMEARMQEYQPTRNQLRHVISERRRREKLKENFHALRLLLPPGYKKDKASVLANAKNYLHSLKAGISELEERNRMLEMQLQPTDDAEGVCDSSKRVEVHISRSSESASETQEINLRLMVRQECDTTDLVLHALECLRGRRDIILVSMDVNARPPLKNICARANLRLQVKASDWDEESFKEAVTSAVLHVFT